MRNSGLALAIIGVIGLSGIALAPAAAQTALSGIVASAEEGAMEGVVVSAKADGSTMTVSMVSDAEGRYAFPAARLLPGHYALAIRAIGYELDGPGAIDIAPGKAASADLKLRKTKVREVWRQMSNAEWLMSIPGSDDQKKFLLNCVGCHTLQRIVTSTHDAAEFEQVIHRMTRYYPGSTPLHPQILAGTFARDAAVGNGANYAQVAKYLASINLSGGSSWEYPLKTMPRPTGRATHVVVTEFALPRPTMEPHDVILDRDGTVWFSNFGEQFLSKMDPATGKVTEFPIPELKPGFPTGTLDLEADPDGNLWVGLMFQAGIAKFDKKTETFALYAAPKEIQGDGTQLGMVTPTHATVDGVVWAKDAASNATLRLNVASGTFENLGVVKDMTGRPLGAYGIPSDAENDLYYLNFGGSEIGRLDAKTTKLVIYPTPTAHSRPRRGRVDSADRLWFAEYAANSIAMFDPKTEQIKEWKAPIPWTSPYDVVPGKDGEVWTASMFTDRVTRLDPATGAFIDYPLPRQTNIRRVFASSDGAVWFGSVHGAAIVKVEPLE
jgi:virginiamycin B lyase